MKREAVLEAALIAGRTAVRLLELRAPGPVLALSVWTFFSRLVALEPESMLVGVAEWIKTSACRRHGLCMDCGQSAGEGTWLCEACLALDDKEFAEIEAQLSESEKP